MKIVRVFQDIYRGGFCESLHGIYRYSCFNLTQIFFFRRQTIIKQKAKIIVSTNIYLFFFLNIRFSRHLFIYILHILYILFT